MTADADPLLPVLRLFGFGCALAVGRTLPSLVSFYRDFKSSGLGLARHRGYGQSACKFYGIFPAPNLSVRAMALSGVAFLGLLVLPGTSLVPGEWRTAVLAAALVAYHLYFSQLYCEAHVGAHVTVLIPPALILLALSPATSPGTTDDATLTVL